MSAPVRVAFVGNCQAQTLESLSGHLGLNIQVQSLPPVFELERFGRPETLELLRSCDFVFHQRVADDYPVPFARPSVLTRELGERAISWPNVYFDGYFPGIHYVYVPGGKVVGPLSDYHFDFVRSAWAWGRSVETLSAAFEDGRALLAHAGAVERSLSQLRERERGLSVTISDVIGARWRFRRMMYTMNHPVDELLVVLLGRLMRRAGLPMDLPPGAADGFAYTLDQVCIPPFPWIRGRYLVGFGHEQALKGRAMNDTASGPVMTEEVCLYPRWHDLFRAYYRTYDAESTRSATVAETLRQVPEPPYP
jgi:hypothetical protein